MSVHFEIHAVILGDKVKNLDHAYPKSFAGIKSDHKAREFASAGGARNYIKKWTIRNAKAVRVQT